MDVIRVLSLLFGAVTAGGLLLIRLALVPAFHRLPEDLSLRMHLAVDDHIDPGLPIFTVLAFVFALISEFQSGLSTLQHVLIALAAALWVAVALNSHLINRPMNVALHRWPEGSAPPEYAAIRRRWDHAHTSRTILGMAALIALIVTLRAR
jgi:hypothetical protein